VWSLAKVPLTAGWAEVHVRVQSTSKLDHESFQILPGVGGPWEVWPTLFTPPKVAKDTGPKIGGDEPPKKKQARRGGIKIVRPRGDEVVGPPVLLGDYGDGSDDSSDDTIIDEGDPDLGVPAPPAPSPDPPAGSLAGSSVASGSAATGGTKPKQVSQSKSHIEFPHPLSRLLRIKTCTALFCSHGGIFQASKKFSVFGHELRYDAAQKTFGAHCNCDAHNFGYASGCKMDRKASKGPLGHMLAWLAKDLVTREDHQSWKTRHFLIEDRKKWRQWAEANIPEACELEALARSGERSEPAVVP